MTNFYKNNKNPSRFWGLLKISFINGLSGCSLAFWMLQVAVQWHGRLEKPGACCDVCFVMLLCKSWCQHLRYLFPQPVSSFISFSFYFSIFGKTLTHRSHRKCDGSSLHACLPPLVWRSGSRMGDCACLIPLKLLHHQIMSLFSNLWVIMPWDDGCRAIRQNYATSWDGSYEVLITQPFPCAKAI